MDLLSNDLLSNNNENFVELKETELDEVNGGSWQWYCIKIAGRAIWYSFKPITVY